MFKTATLNFCLNTTKTNLKSCKKYFFTALASVLFASTGFAKGSETLVNENLNVVTENQLVNEEAPDDTYRCTINIDYYDENNKYVGTRTFVRYVTVWSDESAAIACDWEAGKIVRQIRLSLGQN